MGGQESINEKLRRAVGSKLMDCFFGPQPLKGATALCSAAGTRTLPHSALCRAQELLAVFHVTSERLQGTVRHIPQPPLCPQARVLVYIVAHRILYSYIVPIFRSRTLICKCFISPLYGRFVLLCSDQSSYLTLIKAQVMKHKVPKACNVKCILMSSI